MERDRYRIHLNIISFCGQLHSLSKEAYLLTRQFKVYSQNHNDLSNKGAHSLMINRQMPTKAGDVFIFSDKIGVMYDFRRQIFLSATSITPKLMYFAKYHNPLIIISAKFVDSRGGHEMFGAQCRHTYYKDSSLSDGLQICQFV